MKAIKQYLQGWLARPCPNCGWEGEVGGDWFIRRRRAELYRDHWKFCE